MKKILFYALAAFTVLGAGCSKDAEGLDAPVAEGKYTLPAITASLDDAETRTGLGTNNVVNWSNNDKIAVVNTTNNKISYYVLTSGAGTPVGKFEPVNAAAPATFNSIDDIKAVYPAIAASCTSNTVKVSLNKEYTETERADVGITSWTENSSRYAFTYNDIKVSYKASADFTSNNASIPVNFKFRQLGTWCNFVFNFTADETFAMESMESLTITTTGGTKGISGTADIDFTDPNQPTLTGGSETSITLDPTTGSLSSATLTKSLMLFPVIDGDMLKVTVKTALHTFTFYATPTQAFSAGSILRFPFNVNDNFKAAATAENMTYSVEENTDIPSFYYYGDANCILLAGTNVSGITFDVAPHKTNSYYWVNGDNSTVPGSVMRAKTAKVIWRESGLSLTVDSSVSNNKVSITSASGSGNALVGIYNNDKLLWSYHIWKPEIDPTASPLTYNYTNSGAYTVMPIALGATNKATVLATGTATDADHKAYGLYYQWGRKDPLGRPQGLATGGEAFVTTYAGATGTTAFNFGTEEVDITSAGVLGGEAVTEKDNKSVDAWMIDYVTAHPTKFIVVPNGKYNNDWAGKTNDYLWGNPQGYNFPRNSQLKHRSVFDPCPAGWHVAPKDLWVAFTKSGNNFSSNTSDAANYPENNFNVANLNKTNHTTTLTTQRGYHFYYGMNTNGTKKWQTGETDFYPASGCRNRSNGSLTGVGSYGYCWSSSPYSAGSTGAGLLSFSASSVSPFNTSHRAYGFPVRCVRE